MTFKEMLRAEILSGEKMAQDPINAGVGDLALRETTIDSPWYASKCNFCRYKFREGDWVRLCPQCGKAYHDDGRYGLDCWRQKFGAAEVCTVGGADWFNEGLMIPSCEYVWDGLLPPASLKQDMPLEEPSALLVRQFLGGLSTVWQPFGNHPTFKLPLGSELAGRPCPWCSYLIRVGDWVVACPCGCNAYFHQDVFRHLTCWNEWNGSKGKTHCLNTSRPFPNQEEEAADVE